MVFLELRDPPSVIPRPYSFQAGTNNAICGGEVRAGFLREFGWDGVMRVSLNTAGRTAQDKMAENRNLTHGSTAKYQVSDAALLEVIVGHWDAIENGTHRVRDVTFREDA